MSTDAGILFASKPNRAVAGLPAVSLPSNLPHNDLSAYSPYHDITWRCSDPERSSAIVACLLLRWAPTTVGASDPLVYFVGRSTSAGRPHSQLTVGPNGFSIRRVDATGYCSN